MEDATRPQNWIEQNALQLDGNCQTRTEETT